MLGFSFEVLTNECVAFRPNSLNYKANIIPDPWPHVIHDIILNKISCKYCKLDVLPFKESYNYPSLTNTTAFNFLI